MKRRWRTLLAGLAAMLLSAAAAAPPGYPPVLPQTALVFPRDFGAHPEHRIEWWYLTGWLDPADGAADKHPLGFQLTFFRLRPGVQEGNPSAFAPTQLLFAHAAISDPAHGRLRQAEKSARAGFGLAQAAIGDTAVVIDDWSLQREGDGYLARVRGDGFAYELRAHTTAPPLLQGQAGYSRKGADGPHASHYYSRPQLAVSGWVESAGRRREVGGRAWLDHEWSSAAMPPGAVGWDWLAANLDDGGALMVFRMRDAGGQTLWRGGTLAAAGRPPQTLAPDEIEFLPRRRWKSPRSGGDYPVEMQVRAGPLRLRTAPLLDDQELDARRSVGAIYWEGAVRLLGDDGSERGRGYLELTGYRGRQKL